MHLGIAFKVNQDRDVLLCCESTQTVLLMLEDTLFQVTRDSDIEDTPLAAHDVYKIKFHTAL